jgi:hypothetical protein
MFFPHQANLQQMDVGELKDLLLTVISTNGIDINSINGASGLQALLAGQAGGNQGGGGN